MYVVTLEVYLSRLWTVEKVADEKCYTLCSESEIRKAGRVQRSMYDIYLWILYTYSTFWGTFIGLHVIYIDKLHVTYKNRVSEK